MLVELVEPAAADYALSNIVRHTRRPRPLEAIAVDEHPHRDPGRRAWPRLAELPVPETYRGVVVRADEVGMFDGLATRDKDPRKSLHVQEVPTPELGPGEAIVAVMASAINYNTVWTSIFEPVLDVRLPASGTRKIVRAGRASTTSRTTSSAPTSPASCCGSARA